MDRTSPRQRLQALALENFAIAGKDLPSALHEAEAAGRAGRLRGSSDGVARVVSVANPRSRSAELHFEALRCEPLPPALRLEWVLERHLLRLEFVKLKPLDETGLRWRTICHGGWRMPRRQLTRVQAVPPAMLVVTGRNAAGRAVSGTLCDLSIGGLAFSADAEQPELQPGELLVGCAIDEGSHRSRPFVLRVKQVVPGGRTSSVRRVGTQLVEPTDEVVADLQRLVQQLQRALHQESPGAPAPER